MMHSTPAADVCAVPEPPPCVMCGLPARVRTHDGDDLCGRCGDHRPEPVVTVAAA
jgi:hypothetical protein